MAADVTSLISNAQGYTTSLVTQATNAMQQAVTTAGSIGYSVPNYTLATLPNLPSATIDLTLPTLTDATMEAPPEPTDGLVFQDIPTMDAGVAPSLAATLPTITLPTDPSQLAAFTDVAPAINTSIAFPDPPAALLDPLLDAPTFADHAVPDAPQVLLPSFTATAPVDGTVAPTNLDTVFGNSYASAAPSMQAAVAGYVDSMMAKYNPQYSAQMSAIEAQLSKYLAGGTGLNAAAENAIYERSKSKVNAEALRVRDQALADAATRGFTMPSGALLSATQQARQGGADNNARAAAEIVVMQAEMEQKNLQFAVTTSTGLRTSMLNAALSYMQNLSTINGQALEYGKTVLNAVVETYNTAVKAFEVKLEAYKADAMVYETRLKAAMAGVELYKAEIDALQALTTVDHAEIEIYRARIESLVSVSNLYRTQIEAVQGRVGLEKLKLEMFQAQVQTYATQVQAKSAEWQGYTAAIGGQTAKAQVYETQVRAFGAQVNAYQAVVSAKAEVIRAAAATNQARASQYQAQMSGYSTLVQARGEVARTKIENQRQVILAYQAKVQAQIGNAQVQQSYYKAAADVAIARAEGDIKAQIAGIDSQRAFNTTISQLGTANANIFANLASSALSGMNTLVAQTAAS
jgi:hypothetical protein